MDPRAIINEAQTAALRFKIVGKSWETYGRQIYSKLNWICPPNQNLSGCREFWASDSRTIFERFPPTIFQDHGQRFAQRFCNDFFCKANSLSKRNRSKIVGKSLVTKLGNRWPLHWKIVQKSLQNRWQKWH
jgi:hypothetical protein